jgi:hypothetical protein
MKLLRNNGEEKLCRAWQEQLHHGTHCCLIGFETRSIRASCRYRPGRSSGASCSDDDVRDEANDTLVSPGQDTSLPSPLLSDRRVVVDPEDPRSLSWSSFFSVISLIFSISMES